MKIFLFSPSAISSNLGDTIITAAVKHELSSLFGSASSINQASIHRRLTKEDKQNLVASDLVFVGGSNLLGNYIFRIKTLQFWHQWKISLSDAKTIKNGILLGTGWRQYERRTGWYTKRILQKALSHGFIHSVRDNYTLKKLQQIGFENVLNTGCPTTWPFSNYSHHDFPKERSKTAIVMVTDYKRNPRLDRAFLALVTGRYRKTYCWPQSERDIDYVRRFSLPIEILEHSLEYLSTFLNETDCDYIGTRLHGGIFCLLAKKRSLIIEVDNRARELAKDTGLPTVSRDDIQAIERWIDAPYETNIRVDSDAIRQWKSQFTSTGPQCVF